MFLQSEIHSKSFKKNKFNIILIETTQPRILIDTIRIFWFFHFQPKIFQYWLIYYQFFLIIER